MRLASTIFILLVLCIYYSHADLICSDEIIYPVSSGNERTYIVETGGLESQLSMDNKLVVKDFPLTNSEKVTLILKRKKNIIDQQTVFLVAGYENVDRLRPAVLNTFTGKIAGSENSDVFLCEIGGSLFVQIITDDGSITTLTPEISSGNQGYHILSDVRAIDNDKLGRIKCFSDGKNIPISKLLNDLPLSNNLLETELAIETDTEFFNATGGTVESAQEYLIALLSIVSHHYELEANVRLKLVWVKTWTDNPSDPYDVKGDAYALPSLVSSYWRDNYSEVHRDLAHVITSISYGGGGYGYFNAICGNAGDRSFSVSSVQAGHNMPTFAFTYDAYIVAHELGHNFNARHTHSCYYNGIPIDTCETGEAVTGGCLDSSIKPRPNTGSIMSYCGGRNANVGLGWQVRMTFLPQISNIIRATAEVSSCITEPPEPIISLLNPRGNQVYISEDSVTIMWTSSGVDNIGIMYSTNDGESWTSVAENISVLSGEFRWQFPELCSRNVKFMVYDESVTAVSDTSLPFVVNYADKDKLHAYYPFLSSIDDEQFCHYFNMESSDAKYTTDRAGNMTSALLCDGSTIVKCDEFDASFDELTVSWWFYGDDWSKKQTFVGTNWELGWVFETYFWGQLGVSYYFADTSAPRQLWGGSPTTAKWTHGAFTYDGRIGKLYIDGKMVTELDEGRERGLKKFSKTPLYVGSRSDKDFFTGKLDDIRIYKRALNEDEIKELAEEPATNIEGDAKEKTNLVENYFVADHLLCIFFRDEYSKSKIIDIFDIRGNKVQSLTFSETEKFIDVSNLVKGVYLCRIRTSTQVEMIKFIP